MPSLKEWDTIIHHISNLTHMVVLKDHTSEENMVNWCKDHVGEKYFTWAYTKDHEWYFRDESSALEFALTWS